MNRLENWFCSTGYWRRVTQKQVLPWIISGASLGDHVLEIGAGPGAATPELRRLARRVTSLEWSHAFAANLAAREGDSNGSVLQGDAATLPFANESFSSAVAVLVLHHLRSCEQQDQALCEIYRVLRPGGVLLADGNTRWMVAAGDSLEEHVRSGDAGGDSGAVGCGGVFSRDCYFQARWLWGSGV